MAEMVSHPTHYNAEGRKECIVEMLEKYGFHATAHFALLSAYKYLYREGEKDGNPAEQDISKARWYYEWVDNKAAELKAYEVHDWTLFWDIGKMLTETHELPWVMVGNWKPIDRVKKIGEKVGKIEL